MVKNWCTDQAGGPLALDEGVLPVTGVSWCCIEQGNFMLDDFDMPRLPSGANQITCFLGQQTSVEIVVMCNEKLP